MRMDQAGRRSLRRFAAILAVAALVAGCVPGLPLLPIGPNASPSGSPTPSASPAATARPQATNEYLDGGDRYGVSVAISGRLSAGGSVPVVYLVSGDASAWAVAAGPAAARDGGAILYTGRMQMPAAVSAELLRLHPGRVEVVGTRAAIADSVLRAIRTQLGAATVVERVAATTSYGAAALLSARSFAPGASRTAFVASADDYWSAIAAGPAAASLGAPLLLVTRDSVPAATAAELARLGADHVVIVGDSTAVSARVQTALGKIVATVDRVSGRDRYATAAEILAKYFPAATTVVATSGATDGGALAAVPLAAANHAPIVFVAGGDQLPVATRNSLISLSPRLILTAGRNSPIIRAELTGFSDGRLVIPADTATYPAGSTGYHDPAEMEILIRATAIAYPNLVQIRSIGKSYEGRDIWAAKVSNNVSVDAGEPEVLVDALTHANERLGVEQALYLLATLTAGYATDPVVHRLVDSRVVWIIFAVNPDGWVYDLSGNGYQGWRKNRQPNGKYNPGTDLNRNYGYMWGCCDASSTLPYAWNYRGTAPFSAPETKAVADFVASRVIDGKQRIRTHVTIHTNGEEILYPFAYTLARLPAGMDPVDYAVFRKMAQTMAGMNGYLAEQSSFLYPSDGDEIDWTYATYRIFSFTFELYPGKDAGRGVAYVSDKVIAKQTARNRGALLYLIDAAGCPYAVIGRGAQYCPGSGAAPTATAASARG